MIFSQCYYCFHWQNHPVFDRNQEKQMKWLKKKLDILYRYTVSSSLSSLLFSPTWDTIITGDCAIKKSTTIPDRSDFFLQNTEMCHFNGAAVPYIRLLFNLFIAVKPPYFRNALTPLQHRPLRITRFLSFAIVSFTLASRISDTTHRFGNRKG